MRTTLDIDADVLNIAKVLADARKTSVGKALSDLARRGATARTPVKFRDGFCIFDVPEGTPKFGPEDIQAAEDEDDLRYARYFVKPQR